MLAVKKTILAAAAFTLASTVPPASAADGDPRIVVVSGPLFDPFFSALKKGADDAAEDLGIEYQYSTLQDASNVEADLARLLDQAVSFEPDVLIVGNFFPNALSPIIKRATAAGIPVIIQDGGFMTWKEVGAFTYVGYDPVALGAQSATIQTEAGVKNGLCINHVPGNPTLEALCNAYVDGIVKSGGKGKVLTITYQDSQNPQANLQAIKGALEADPEVNGIMTLGATQTTLSVQAADEAGRAAGTVRIGGMGLSTKVLEDIRDGKVFYGVDLQPYLDGYYGILIAYQKAKYEMMPAAPVFAGPRFIHQADAQKVIEINAEFVGIRGTN